MRVSSTHFPQTLAAQLQRLTARQNAYQAQIASGQRIETADQDPAAVGQTLGLQAETRGLGQFASNIHVHDEFATATFGVIRSLKSVSDRAGEIATLADGTKSPEDLRAYAIEIEQLIQQAIDSANSKHRGSYLLSGTKSDVPAFTAVKNASGKITAVTFQGNNDVPESEIAPGVLVASRVPGASSGGAGERGLLSDGRTGADFFGHLITLHQQLLAGDTAGIAATTRGDLAKDEENFLFHLGNNGALQSRLEAALKSNGEQSDTVSGEISRRTETNIPETIVRLNQAQMSYQAALQSAGSMLQLSLLDFLR